MNGNKIISGILSDLKILPKKALKPYMRNGKINKNKVAIDLIPFSILFYFTNKYLQAVCASTKTDAFDKCIEAFTLIFQVPPVAIPCFKALPLIGGIAAGVIFKLYLNSRKKKTG